MAVQHIFVGTTAPATTPTALGQHYINTVAGDSYISTGTSSSADWKISDLALPVALANGGSGLSNVYTPITTSSTPITALALTTSKYICAGTVSQFIYGIVSDGTAKEVTFVNACNPGVSLFVGGNAVASANNRIVSTQESSQSNQLETVKSGYAITLIYDTSINRWRPINRTYSAANGATTGIIEDGVALWNGVKTFANVTNFNSSITLAGFTSGTIPYIGGGGGVTQSSNVLTWDNTLQRFGVQVPVGSAEASVHSRTLNSVLAIDVVGTAVLTLFNTPATPTAALAEYALPTMGRATNTAANISYGPAGYLANGKTIDYIIYQGNSIDGRWTVAGSVVASCTDDNSAQTYLVSVTWDAGTTGTVVADEYRIFRQINGGGYTDYRDSTTPGLPDANTGWIAGAPPPMPTYYDFLADGSTRNYLAYSEEDTPISTQTYSPSNFPYTYMDANDGEPYRVAHTITTSNTSVRIIGNADGVATDSHIDGPSSFIEDSNSWTLGAVVTPNNYGIQSNGVLLNRQYQFYGINPLISGIIYSTGVDSQSVSDPSDGLYYYVIITSSTYKVLRNISSAGFLDSKTTSGSFYDDDVTVFEDNVAITPTIGYPPAIYGEGFGVIKTGFRLSAPEFVPTISSDSGLKGQMVYDDDYFYVCVEDNNWKRVALIAF